ncbi:MAG TPA: tRNA (guanosine(37)-N1)-methyltransferase TrmD [bacterium]|nr:tRNA (guanosine(37)-N1)-methyltransferase TrmD [bacterium]
MHISIITLFPGMFDGMVTSMLKKAVDEHILELELIDLRLYGLGKRRSVDDQPYGGGGGMILRPEPLAAAIAAARERIVSGSDDRQAPVILMTPQGTPYTQTIANRYAKLDSLILVCGHYEGVDERVRELLVSEEISIGDYVLTGGEIPAMVVLDSVVRLLPGVLGAEEGAAHDSFQNGMLEYPQYTRPLMFQGQTVPSVLLSGNHGEIAKWRTEQSEQRTRQRRPDLLVRK